MVKEDEVSVRDFERSDGVVERVVSVGNPNICSLIRGCLVPNTEIPTISTILRVSCGGSEETKLEDITRRHKGFVT